MNKYRITLFKITTIEDYYFNNNNEIFPKLKVTNLINLILILFNPKQNDKKKEKKRKKNEIEGTHFNFIPSFKESWIQVKLLLSNSPKSQEHRKFSTIDETIPSLHPPLDYEARQLYWKPAETENNFVSISSSLQKRIHEAAVKEQASGSDASR